MANITSLDVWLDNFFLNFENLFKPQFGNTSNPPYNLMKLDENNMVLEFALAGFKKEDINITTNPNSLVVEGRLVNETDEKTKYIHKGIAQRHFKKEMALSPDVVVKEAVMDNGLLKIYLERIVPEHKQSRTIEIVDSGNETRLFDGRNESDKT